MRRLRVAPVQPLEGRNASRVALVVVLGLILSFVAGKESAGSEFSVRLVRGWNLVTLPHGVGAHLEPTEAKQGLQIFAISGQGDASREVRFLPSTEVTHYWIYAPSEQALPFRTDQTDKSIAPRPNQGWQLFAVHSPVPHVDPVTERLLYWDANTNHYRSVTEGEVLLPGHAYWRFTRGPPTQSVAGSQRAGSTADVLDQTWAQVMAPSSRNYEQALDARNVLERSGPSEKTDFVAFYQVEYQSNDVESYLGIDEGLDEDAKYLARFERVWAYTQGIALAQLSDDPDASSRERAQGFAHFLCAHAVEGRSPGGDDIILGWPFSWNTKNDAWKDSRLVTGANAWALHGLGSFIVSDASWTLAAAELDSLLSCYKRALLGLGEHRHTVKTPHGTSATLMTAGWTTRGLQHAGEPQALLDNLGVPLARLPDERFGYYSILDAIGYHTVHPDRPPEVARWRIDSSGRKVELAPLTLTETTFSVLRERVKATNVVTEHNVDVLSVLNHALDHPTRLQIEAPEDLEKWRNELRDGIFYVLWDADGVAPGHDPEDRGRVITGGEFAWGGDGGREFVASEHVAVDNCSWLSLSVDYDELPRESGYVSRLGRCLEYTVQMFARPFEIEGEVYYGAHYFLNDFQDPYIRPSIFQEESYHLEATTGLILGLLKFAAAYPEDPRSEYLRTEALDLWAGAERFVADYGFPYSSQRIQDLSTQLSSSTALIWYIDTYNYLAELKRNRGSFHGPTADHNAEVHPGGVDAGVNPFAEWIASLDALEGGPSPIERLTVVGQGEDQRVVVFPTGFQPSNAAPEDLVELRTGGFGGRAISILGQQGSRLLERHFPGLAKAPLGAAFGASTLGGINASVLVAFALGGGGDNWTRIARLRASPSEDTAWVRIGYVRASEVLYGPILLDEANVRQKTLELTMVKGELKTSSFRFDVDTLYGIVVPELFENQRGALDVSFRVPDVWSQDALLEVYEFAPDASSNEADRFDQFYAQDPFWVWAKETAQHLGLAEEAFLSWAKSVLSANVPTLVASGDTGKPLEPGQGTLANGKPTDVHSDETVKMPSLQSGPRPIGGTHVVLGDRVSEIAFLSATLGHKFSNSKALNDLLDMAAELRAAPGVDHAPVLPPHLRTDLSFGAISIDLATRIENMVDQRFKNPGDFTPTSIYKVSREIVSGAPATRVGLGVLLPDEVFSHERLYVAWRADFFRILAGIVFREGGFEGVRSAFLAPLGHSPKELVVAAWVERTYASRVIYDFVPLADEGVQVTARAGIETIASATGRSAYEAKAKVVESIFVKQGLQDDLANRRMVPSSDWEPINDRSFEAAVSTVMERVGYTFKDERLSIFGIQSDRGKNQGLSLPAREWLEYVGDSVLELIVQDYLATNLSGASISFLRDKKVSIVNNENFAEVARSLGIDKVQQMGKGGVGTKPLADAFEAMVGGIFFDSDYESTREVFGPVLLSKNIIDADRNRVETQPSD